MAIKRPLMLLRVLLLRIGSEAEMTDTWPSQLGATRGCPDSRCPDRQAGAGAEVAEDHPERKIKVE
jgi:hypothetical protein